MTGFTCPECRAPAPNGTRAGAAYACPRCGNPVLPAPALDRGPERAPEGGAPAPGRPAWKLALLAFFVLGAAYFGLYELLTAEAKRERDRLFAKHGAAVTTFADPGAAPQGADPADLKAYVGARERFEDRRVYESRVSRIGTMFTALLLAFGAQTAFTAILLVRTAVRMRSARERTAPASRA